MNQDDDFPEFAPEDRFRTWAHTGGNVFLTGQAGTGKSYLLKEFLKEAKTKVAVTAPTGIAALNIGGTTTHRWAGMQLGPRPEESIAVAAMRVMEAPQFHGARGRIVATDTLVIDEISMMSGRHLDLLNRITQEVRGCDKAFGGLQVILLGDFMQLPPVRTDSSPYDWAFNSEAWKAADLKTIRLEKVRRQEDAMFIAALSGFRVGKLSKQGADILRSRVSMFPKASITRLCTHNAQVDKWNKYRLDSVEGAETVLKARTKGVEQAIEFVTKSMSTPRVLTLKVGAAVMFTCNDAEQGFANGQIGIVVGLRGDSVSVESRGKLYDLEPRKFFFESLGVTVWQVPLRLAYAMTIHRAQGLTLDAAYVDVRAAREPGQAYVALSRVRTLAGLHLKEWPKGWFISEEALRFEK